MLLRCGHGVVSVMLRWNFDGSSMVLRWMFEGTRPFLPFRTPLWGFQTASHNEAPAWSCQHGSGRYPKGIAFSCRLNPQRKFCHPFCSETLVFGPWALDFPPALAATLTAKNRPTSPAALSPQAGCFP